MLKVFTYLKDNRPALWNSMSFLYIPRGVPPEQDTNALTVSVTDGNTFKAHLINTLLNTRLDIRTSRKS